MQLRSFTVTAKELQPYLIRACGGDVERVKLLAKNCKTIGLPIGENIDALVETDSGNVVFTPELVLLISYSDMGILGKLTEVIENVQKKQGK